MRVEFDNAAFYRWLMKEAEEMDWGGEEAEPDDWSLEMEEETIEEARQRMTAEEAVADRQWEKGQR